MAFLNIDQTLSLLWEFWSVVIITAVVIFTILSLGSRILSSEEADESVSSLEPSFEQISANGQSDKGLQRILDRSDDVIEEQLDAINESDDMALRTVRLEVILLGAIASAAQLAEESIPINLWMEVGGVFIVGSIIVGVFTYSSSSPDFGPGPRYIHEKIQNEAQEKEIYLKLLEGYNSAIGHNRGVVSDSGRYLYITQSLLIMGVIFIGIGVLVEF